MKNKALLNGTEKIEQVRNKNKPRLSFSTLSLRRKKNNKESSTSDKAQTRSVSYEEEKNNIQNRPLPETPAANKNSVMQLSEVFQDSILPDTDNTSDSESIYEAVIHDDYNLTHKAFFSEDFEEHLNTDKSDSAYASISELSLDDHQNNESTGSGFKIWNSMLPRDKELLKNLDSYPIFKSIKSAIKESLGNKNDCRYILAKFSFDSLINPYKREIEVHENPDYIAMNGMKTYATFENLFEKMVLIVSQDLDDLFCISNSDNCRENDYMLMNGAESVYMNKVGFFKEIQREEEIQHKTLELHQ